jgi:biopolymer transport protein ExbD
MGTKKGNTMEGDGIRKDFLIKTLSGPKAPFTLRMAPMIDMVFLLLLFFLVAVRWRPQEDFIPLNIPSVEAASIGLARPEPMQIHIRATADGCQVDIAQAQSVQINEQTMETNLAELMEKIRLVLLEQKRLADDPVEIICEPDVKSQYWVRICNVLYGMKITDITFAVTGWQGGEN